MLVGELTLACELTCKHCPADAKRKRQPDELTTAESKEVLDEARRFGDGQLAVHSEPVVHSKPFGHSEPKVSSLSRKESSGGDRSGAWAVNTE